MMCMIKDVASVYLHIIHLDKTAKAYYPVIHSTFMRKEEREQTEHWVKISYYFYTFITYITM
jgi:predicted SnoaL-like aldol condensation-catalyzing enzyme